MPNTLHAITPEHEQAHQVLGIERQIRANLQDRWGQLVTKHGEGVVRKVWTESGIALRAAAKEHAKFHPRGEA